MIKIMTSMQKSFHEMEEPAFHLLHYGSLFAGGVLALALLMQLLPVTGVFSYLHTQNLFSSIIEVSLTLLVECIMGSFVLDYMIKSTKPRK